MVQITAIRAGIVAGVSSGENDGEERPVTEQRQECEAVCGENNWAIADRYEMVQSASRFAKKERELWLDLQRDIEAGHIDAVVMWEPSRGSRDLTDWSGLLDRCRRAKTLIHVVDHECTYNLGINADWKVLADHGVDSAHESNKISDRTRRAAEHSARAGRPHSQTYGYRHAYTFRTGGSARNGKRMRADS